MESKKKPDCSINKETIPEVPAKIDSENEFFPVPDSQTA